MLKRNCLSEVQYNDVKCNQLAEHQARVQRRHERDAIFVHILKIVLMYFS